MANYYYDKYNLELQINQDGTWKLPTNLNNPDIKKPGTDVREILPTNPISLGASISQNSALNDIAYIPINYNFSDEFYVFMKNEGTWYYYGYDDYQLFNSTHLRTVKGSLVTSRIKLDGTYPIDGAHSDGFYYVRGALATIPINILVNGSFVVSEKAYVNVNGVWKEIKEIHQMQNGAWSKLF